MDASSFIIGVLVAAVSRGSLLTTGAERIALPEPAFCAALGTAAEKLGVQLYVFSEACCDDDESSLTGFRYVKHRWESVRAPLPDIVYDRCFYVSKTEQQRSAAMLERMNHNKKHILLSSQLPSKLAVYEMLCKEHQVGPYLPETVPCQSARQVLDMISRHHQGAIIKPACGMQGRGIVRLRKLLLQNGYLAEGRTIHNKPFTKLFATEAALLRWAAAYRSKLTLMLQPYLPLVDPAGTPYDIRVLLQKDDSGRWKHTGSAARIGQHGSLTSNLHGGGKAAGALEWLGHSFSMEEAERLLNKLHIISHRTAESLERSFGRFAELAFDFGIEPNGAIWLLEANAKPGRSAFGLIGDDKAKQLSIDRLLLYASLLSRRLPPSFMTNESANGRPLLKKAVQLVRPLNVQEVHQ